MDNHAGLIVENAKREVLICNSKFCEIFGIPYKPEALIWTDCSKSSELVKHIFKHPDLFVSDIELILERKEPVINDILYLANGKKMKRDYLPIFSGDVYIGHTWQYYLLD